MLCGEIANRLAQGIIMPRCVLASIIRMSAFIALVLYEHIFRQVLLARLLFEQTIFGEVTQFVDCPFPSRLFLHCRTPLRATDLR